LDPKNYITKDGISSSTVSHTKSVIEEKIPVTVIMNDSPNTLAMDFLGKFHYKDVKLFKEKDTNLTIQA
jgi:hypothetical protein